MGRVLRRALGGLLVFGLVVAAFAYFTYSPYLMLTLPESPSTTAEPASDQTAGTPAESRTPTSTPSAGAEDGQPTGSDGREPGIRLVATVAAGRVFAVTETVRLPAPVTRLSLVPPDLRAAGGDLRSARAVATDLVVRVDDRRVRLAAPTVDRATTVTLTRATDHIEISYRLRGAIRLNRPSWAGRAIGAVGPLVSGVPGGLPVSVSFRSEAVSNVNCVRLPPAQRNCFGGRRPNISVNQDLAHRDALVQVQLDLQLAPKGGRQ